MTILHQIENRHRQSAEAHRPAFMVRAFQLYCSATSLRRLLNNSNQDQEDDSLQQLKLFLICLIHSPKSN